VGQQAFQRSYVAPPRHRAGSAWRPAKRVASCARASTRPWGMPNTSPTPRRCGSIFRLCRHQSAGDRAEALRGAGGDHRAGARRDQAL